MTADPGGGPATSEDPVASVLELLNQIQQENPEVADRVLQDEVAKFLGQVAETPEVLSESTRPAMVTMGPEPERTLGAHDWYSLVASQVPDHDDERNWLSAQAVEAGLLARERLESIAAQQLSRQDLADLHTLKEEGEAAWKWLITANLGLVFYWSRGVARTIDPDWAQDAFQAGCIGLIRGLERWDHTLGSGVPHSGVTHGGPPRR